ncbi:MAG: nucleotidyl transferase AbiEii/AbiGii toxin family protein [Candidatus Parvarchaeota archaeon]|nr:nucleotidyl transferase AbiEii/AbiGii toxin family protein [Candidatus Parvarchaeota archaeon]
MEEMIYRALAGKLGLSMNFVIKDYYLMRLLQYVSLYGNDKFVLTGGTAINKIYLKDKARFSEDADFELIRKPSLASVIKTIDGISANAKEFLGKKRRMLKAYCQVDFSYHTSNYLTDKVRLDVAFNELADKNSFVVIDEITSPFSQERAHGLAVYKLEELLARKLYAIHERMEGKDLYDVFYSMEMADKRKLYAAAKKFLVKKGIDFGTAIDAIIEKLRNIDNKYITAKTNSYIPLSLRPTDWRILSNSIADYLSILR